MSLKIIKAKGVAGASLAELQAASAELNARIGEHQVSLNATDAAIAAEALNFAAGDVKRHDTLRNQKRQTESDLAVLQTAKAQVDDQIALVETWGEQSKVLDRFAAALQHSKARGEAIVGAREALKRCSELLQAADEAELEAKKLVDGLGGHALMASIDYAPALDAGYEWLRRQGDAVAGKDMEAKILKMRAAYCQQAGISVPAE